MIPSSTRLSQTAVSVAGFGSIYREQDNPEIRSASRSQQCGRRELEVMADKLAGNMIKASSQEGWRAPGIEYYKVHGQSHAFEGFPTKDVEAEKATVAAADAMLSKISDWLTDPFSNAHSG